MEATLMTRCSQVYSAIDRQSDDPETLRDRVEKLFKESLTGDFPQEKRLLAKMIVMVAPSSTPQEPFPFSEAVLERRFGTVNQYSDELDAMDQGKQVSSACTSCAQCFLSRALTWNGVVDIKPEEINEIVHDGKANYELMLHRARMAHKENPLVPLYQAFSHTDTKDIYGLEHVNCENGQVLVRDDEEQSTHLFFKAELIKLEEHVMRNGSLGGILHSQGKTYALVVYHRGDHFEYALFDSHGNQELNGTKAAYVWVSKDQDQMADALARLIPYVPTVLADIPSSQRRVIEAEDNGVILYIVGNNEHAAYPRLGHSSAASSETHNHSRGEAEKTNYIAIMILVAAATLIAFRNRLISIVSSYTGKDGQKMLPPLPTSRSVRVE